MKPRSKPLRRLLYMGLGLLLSSILLYLLFLRPTPIKVGGFTSFTDENTMIFEVINKGFADVELLDVRVNNGMKPAKSELGVSYSLHLVGGGGLDEDPDIEFVDLRKVPLKPEIMPDKKRAALNQGSRIPLNYGVRLYNDEPITQIEVKYRYWGITFTREMPMGRFFNKP
ncbi:hypothetical protein AK95_27235 [Paenibacillus sp. LC231]|uniref:hypothetical protein n=1 Tax=Paenibacillus sp. LC231 TaxID=1120679 RepID=UPI0008DCF3CD|nr:hypothetical protein [Paenibacillus sp. LC231]OIB00846.1 hypothetical protein AK95_27235 [Paenibacillus sp. LC231]